MSTLRSKVNAAAASKSGLGGLLGYWYFYMSQVVDWNRHEILLPDNLETLVVQSFMAFTGVATIGGWNRDKPSAVEAPASPVINEMAVSGPAKLKNWFSDAELDCKCQDLPGCDYRGIHPTTLRIMNEVREEFGAQFVNSGYRCPAHNKAVGGADSSYHVKGMAGDISSPSVAPKVIYDWLCKKYPSQYGFGLYKKFVHIDARTDSFARKAGPDKAWRSYDLDLIIL
jgi:hypothetical protein